MTDNSPYGREEIIGPCEPTAANSPAQRPTLPDNWDALTFYLDSRGANTEMLRAVKTQPLSPRDVFWSVRLAALKWYYALSDRFTLEDLLLTGFCAFLANASRVLADSNPRGFCYRIAWRIFYRIYYEEHPSAKEDRDEEEFTFDSAKHSFDTESCENVCEAIAIGDAYGVSGTTFRQPASPDEFSRMVSERAEQDWFQDKLTRLPDAMDGLSPEERAVTRAYYGIGHPELTVRQIAETLHISTRRVYYSLESAARKLREFLESDEHTVPLAA